jgi:hypothetical protein
MWLELLEHGPSTTLEVRKKIEPTASRSDHDVRAALFHEDVILAADLAMKLLVAGCKIFDGDNFQARLPDINKVGWPNGKALDYESRDCRFDPCVDHSITTVAMVVVLSIVLL